MTYREQFEEAMKCKTEEEASLWMVKEIIRYKEDFRIEADQARETILSNIGYMAGYYDDKVAKKIYELFKAPHPVFGPPGTAKKISSENILRLGMEAVK